MIAPSHSVARIAACFCTLLLTLVSGCLYPGPYRNYPGGYGQPMYTPPQTINPGGPGSLYIPESQGPAYNPGGTFDDLGGGTYDDDPEDDFDALEGDSRFFEGDPEDRVPQPRGLGDDLGVDGIGFQQDGRNTGGNIQQISGVGGPSEYGFDTLKYSWLRGTVELDPYSRRWLVNYSPGRNDRYEGMLSLSATEQQLLGIHSGDWVDVRGHLHSTRKDRSGRPLFVVESIVRLEP